MPLIKVTTDTLRTISAQLNNSYTDFQGAMLAVASAGKESRSYFTGPVPNKIFIQLVNNCFKRLDKAERAIHSQMKLLLLAAEQYDSASRSVTGKINDELEVTPEQYRQYQRLGIIAASNYTVYYNQHEGEWADKAFSEGNYSTSGCGPTSMAMVVCTLLGLTVTPKDIGDAYINKHGRVATSGRWMFFESAAAYGLKCELKKFEDIEETLMNGGRVIVSTYNRGKKLFTNGSGHFLVISGATEIDGKKMFIIDDSDFYDTKYAREPRSSYVKVIDGRLYVEPEVLEGEIYLDSVYCISK